MKWLTQRIVAPSLARSNRVSRPRSGDYGDVEIPVLISNTEVKHISADDSRKAKIGRRQSVLPKGSFFHIWRDMIMIQDREWNSAEFELSRMRSGQWYDANFDPELLSRRQKADELCFAFNQCSPADQDGRQRLLRELIPELGENVTVLTPLYADYGSFTSIGSGSFLNHGCYLMDGGGIAIGRECYIGPFCGFYTATHAFDPEERAQGLEKAEKITLEERVWLGASVSVLPGVTIGTGAVIGAGSVVTRDIPPMTVAAGNPCRILRRVTEQDRVNLKTLNLKTGENDVK